MYLICSQMPFSVARKGRENANENAGRPRRRITMMTITPIYPENNAMTRLYYLKSALFGTLDTLAGKRAMVSLPKILRRLQSLPSAPIPAFGTLRTIPPRLHWVYMSLIHLPFTRIAPPPLLSSDLTARTQARMSPVPATPASWAVRSIYTVKFQ